MSDEPPPKPAKPAAPRRVRDDAETPRAPARKTQKRRLYKYRRFNYLMRAKTDYFFRLMRGPGVLVLPLFIIFMHLLCPAPPPPFLVLPHSPFVLAPLYCELRQSSGRAGPGGLLGAGARGHWLVIRRRRGCCLLHCGLGRLRRSGQSLWCETCVEGRPGRGGAV